MAELHYLRWIYVPSVFVGELYDFVSTGLNLQR
jgi:hypothetical protein